jgi:Zn finger protein HypA/HybF involved in hydrogenase expression
VLIRKQGKKLRCRRCHLSIGEEELGEGFCPECREASGVRHRDFEEIESEDDGTVTYCCEACGALIKAG